jgi:hypothetical protein
MLYFYTFSILIFLSSCQKNDDFEFTQNRINGLSVVAPPREIDEKSFKNMQENNANWISLMPYAFLKKEEIKLMTNYGENTKSGFSYWGETPAGISACAKMAHQHGLKVMIKPHLWVNRGEFVGNLDFNSEEDWQKFEKQYAQYIIDFAKVADSSKVEMLCIGTELKIFAQKRPAFWFGLIKDVRKVYQGKLTYAENWDAFAEVKFWKELDYIGVDGYFPLSEKPNPSIAEIRKGWSQWKKKMKNLANEQQKSIIFTEIGFQAAEGSLAKPWESVQSEIENQEIQAKAYQAMFEELETEQWFNGIFIWKWFTENNREQGFEKYSPQTRKAEAVIKNYFGKK